MTIASPVADYRVVARHKATRSSKAGNETVDAGIVRAVPVAVPEERRAAAEYADLAVDHRCGQRLPEKHADSEVPAHHQIRASVAVEFSHGNRSRPVARRVGHGWLECAVAITGEGAEGGGSVKVKADHG